MNTQTVDKPNPNILKRDADGNTYSLPAFEVNAFVISAEAVGLAEPMSAEWFSAVDDLNAQYGEYRIE